MSRGFEHFEHTAEMGLRAWAPGLEEAFVEVARGMFAVILDLETVEERLTRRVAVVASDAEELVVRWLNEFVFLLDTERLVFRSFTIERFSRWSIDATARGEQLDRARHQPRAEVKSATYYRLVVEEGPPARIEVILDI